MDDDEITDIDYVGSELGGDHAAVTTHHGQQSPPTMGLQPTLSHRVKNKRSILALVVSDQKIYAGTQGGEILVRPPGSSVRRMSIDLDRSGLSKHMS